MSPDHELVRVDPEDVHRLGQLVASSMYFEDAREAAQAAVKILAGQELGLGPIASMRGIDIIKGEVTLAAGLVAALVRRSGVYDYAIEAWTNSECRIRFYRHGKALEPASLFTLEDARRANLTGSNWQRYPRNMLFARAMTNGARLHCPDVFVGAVYTPDELTDLPPLEASAVEEPPEVPEDRPEPEWPPEGSEGPSPDVFDEASGYTTEAEAARAHRPIDVAMITDSQYGYITGLIRQGKAHGMRAENLYAMLGEVGFHEPVEEGWLRRLTRDQASGLIERLQIGLPTARPQHPIDPAGT